MGSHVGHDLVFPSLRLWLHLDVDRSSALRLVVDTDSRAIEMMVLSFQSSKFVSQKKESNFSAGL